MSLIDELKKYKEPESKKIYDELFKTTSEHKYYSLGVAQGIYFIYNAINEYNKKGIVLSNAELMQVIRECTELDENISCHFIRMLKDIKKWIKLDL